jgi:hypothetical protein
LTSEPDLTARRHDAIGRIMQNGYVVHDWRNAAEHWGSVLGVGPFFSMQHVDFEWCEYRGQRVQIDMSVGIAYSGDFQIELVQQHNDAPSIYLDFLRDNKPGLQHVGALTGNLSQTLQQSGLQEKIIQQGLTRAGVRFAYLDTVAFNGTMLELIETNPAMLKSFAYMQKAALQWDGKECIRG